MAADLKRAMDRLKHRDVRTRRRAVRTLFETDDPQCLEGFQRLLNDKDTWFVTKALDAYRIWAPRIGVEAIHDLVNHSSVDVRRCGANLLEAFASSSCELALKMVGDDDTVVRKKAAECLVQHGDEKQVTPLLTHSSESIRALALSHSTLDIKHITEALSDASATVRTTAFRTILKRDESVDSALLSPFFAIDSEVVNLFIWCSKHQPKELSSLASRLNGTHIQTITKFLRTNVETSQDPIIQTLLDANMHHIVARWLWNQGDSEDTLRWSIINNDDVDLIERSKLLERLIGRAAEAEILGCVEELMGRNPHPLLMGACENLSTAAKEVSP